LPHGLGYDSNVSGIINLSFLLNTDKMSLRNVNVKLTSKSKLLKVWFLNLVGIAYQAHPSRPSTSLQRLIRARSRQSSR
jgi:hypothetical protein